MQVGKPSVRGPERLAAWTIEDLAPRRALFLPGMVLDTSLGDIPALIGAAVVRTGPRESVTLQFRQSTRNAHLGASRQLERLRARHSLKSFGVLVRAERPLGELLERAGSAKDAKLGVVALEPWVQVAGRRQAARLAPIRATLHARRRRGTVRLLRVPRGRVFGPALFCPEWWCLDPLCHAHWSWFPGIPATTSCGGLCPIGGPCQCWQTGLPSGWMRICTGLTLCLC